MIETDTITSPESLSGVIVLDCVSLFAGPAATTMLGDFDAGVTKVEHPNGGSER